MKMILPDGTVFEDVTEDFVLQMIGKRKKQERIQKVEKWLNTKEDYQRQGWLNTKEDYQRQGNIEYLEHRNYQPQKNNYKEFRKIRNAPGKRTHEVILEHLQKSPDKSFSFKGLQRLTGAAAGTVSASTIFLMNTGKVERFRHGKKLFVRLRRE